MITNLVWYIPGIGTVSIRAHLVGTVDEPIVDSIEVDRIIDFLQYLQPYIVNYVREHQVEIIEVLTQMNESAGFKSFIYDLK